MGAFFEKVYFLLEWSLALLAAGAITAVAIALSAILFGFMLSVCERWEKRWGLKDRR